MRDQTLSCGDGQQGRAPAPTSTRENAGHNAPSYRMESRPHLRSAPFVLAIAVSMVLVLSAPFIGFVRSWIRTTFPGQFVRIIGGAIAVLAVVAVGSRCCESGPTASLRYGAIVASLVFAALVLTRRSDRQSRRRRRPALSLHRVRCHHVSLLSRLARARGSGDARATDACRAARRYR